MRHIFLLVVFISLIVKVSAQETPEFRQFKLRVPDVQHYVEGIPQIINAYDWQINQKTGQVIQAVEAEFLWRYGEQGTFEHWLNTFDQIKTGIYEYTGVGGAFPAIDYNFWIRNIVQKWFDENQVNLDRTKTLQFADFSAEVVKHDFNGDNQNEWILNVRKGTDYVEYSNYIVVELEDNRLIALSVPVPWRGAEFDEESSHGAPLNELGFQDVNADGLNEWIFQSDVFLAGPGYTVYSPTKYVVGWQNRKLVPFAEINGLTYFENLDDDPALEIVKKYETVDNWNCGYVTITPYDWNGKTYKQLSDRIDDTDCTARWAEEAMWSGDFELALTLYDQFLSKYRSTYENSIRCDCNWSRIPLIYSYFLGRRIIAYALTGKEDQLAYLLAQGRKKSASSFEGTLAQTNSDDAQILCQAAYDYFTNYSPGFFDEEFNFVPGDIYEDVSNGWRIGTYFDVDPRRAGCDITLFSGTPTITPSPTFTPNPTYPFIQQKQKTDLKKWIESLEVSVPFNQGNYKAVLSVTEQGIAQPDRVETNAMRYWRALALEALNRPDEALAQYIKIYETSPDSAWEMLAGLHLEQSK